MTDADTTTRAITIERDFPHPPERVWRALTQPHLIEQWLMRNDFEAQQGHRFRLSGDWGGVDCQVLIIEPQHILSYSWDYPHETPALNVTSIVTFTLTAIDTGTRLSMEHEGFRPENTQAFAGANLGWSNYFTRLSKLLDQPAQ